MCFLDEVDKKCEVPVLFKYYLRNQTRVDDYSNDSNVAYSNTVSWKYNPDDPPCPAGSKLYDPSQVSIDEETG